MIFVCLLLLGSILQQSRKFVPQQSQFFCRGLLFALG